MSAESVGDHLQERHGPSFVRLSDRVVGHVEHVALAQVPLTTSVKGLVVAFDGVLRHLVLAVSKDVAGKPESFDAAAPVEDVHHEAVGNDVTDIHDSRVHLGLPGLSGHRRQAENLGGLVGGDQLAEVAFGGHLPFRDHRHCDVSGTGRSDRPGGRA